MHVIYFNGPPGSGKDTLAEQLVRQGMKTLGGRRRKLRHEVDVIAAEIIGIDVTVWGKMMEDREKKDKPSKLLPKWSAVGTTVQDGQDLDRYMTPREFTIWVSEKMMKPFYGPEIFGKRAASRLYQMGQEPDTARYVVAYTDVGFPDEIRPLSECTDIDEQVIVRLFRAGTSYRSDSRNYLPDNHLGIKTIDFVNDAPLKLSMVSLISLLSTTVPTLAQLLSINRFVGAPV